MASELSFTDNTGAVTLTNGLNPPGDRFQAWKPLVTRIGPIHHALGTGVPYTYTHRVDHGASFKLPYIPNDQQADCLRLMIWLMQGGSITVTTGDSLGAVYTTCYLWPGSTPDLSEPDPKDLRRVLSLAVLNAEGDPMTCIWP